MAIVESRSTYSGPVRRSLERGERLSINQDKQIKGLNTSIEGIGGQVGSIEDQVDVLESQIVTLQSQISGLNSSVGTLQGQVSTLQGQVGSLTTTVGGLQTQVTNQTAAIENRALGNLAFRGLAFSGAVDAIIGLNVSGTLGPVSLVGHRYKITLHLAATYGGTSLVALYINGSTTGRNVWMNGNSTEWSSAVAEWVFDLSGSVYFDAVVVGIGGTPKIHGDSASFFEISDMGPAR